MQRDNHSLSQNIGQFLICFIIIGVTIISFPTGGVTYAIVRCIQAIEVLVLAALFIPNIKHVMKFDKFNLLVNAWWIIYLIITFTHPTDVGITPVFTWLNVAIFLLLGKVYWKENMRGSLKCLVVIFSILIYMNAILLILFPEGLWIDSTWVGRGDPTRYLFGNQNQTGFVCMLAVVTQCLYTFAYNKGKFNLFLLIVVSLVSVIFHASMTSVIGLTLIIAYILLHRIFKHPKIWLIIFAALYVTVFMLIIWYGNDIDQVKWATTFIENTLSKDTTFSKRTVIWENAVELIRQHPIGGYGIQNVEWNDENLQGSGTHNLWVMLLLNGGMISCFFFIFITLFAIRNALLQKSKVTTTIVMALCILFVMSFFEAYNIIYIFLFLQLVYYSPCLQPRDHNLDEKENANLLQ